MKIRKQRKSQDGTLTNEDMLRLCFEIQQECMRALRDPGIVKDKAWQQAFKEQPLLLRSMFVYMAMMSPQSSKLVDQKFFADWCIESGVQQAMKSARQWLQNEIDDARKKLELLEQADRDTNRVLAKIMNAGGYTWVPDPGL